MLSFFIKGWLKCPSPSCSVAKVYHFYKDQITRMVNIHFQSIFNLYLLIILINKFHRDYGHNNRSFSLLHYPNIEPAALLKEM